MKRALGPTTATVFALACGLVACGGSVRSDDIDETGGAHAGGDDRDGGTARGGRSGSNGGSGAASNDDRSGSNGGRTGARSSGGAPGNAATRGGAAGSSTTGSSTGSGGSSGASGKGGDVSTLLPADIRTKPTVWIGQTDRAATLPEMTDPEKSTQRQKVVVILGAIVDDASVRGTVTFGDGPPPPAPKSTTAPYPPRSASFNSDFSHLPYAGFEYSIVESVLTDNHLTLAYVPAQLFRSWCALFQPGQPIPAQDSYQMCKCTDTECSNATDLIDRFDLIVDVDSMGGTLSASTSDLSTVVEVRLKRVN